MSKRRVNISRGSYDNGDDYARDLLRSGGPDFDELASGNFGAGEYAQIVRATYGTDFAETVVQEQRAEQKRRSHVFVHKWKSRRRMIKPLTTATEMTTEAVAALRVTPPPRLITEVEFAAVYAAAEFASEFSLWFDTTLTISWRLLGCDNEQKIAAAFSAFEKCLHDWLTQRSLTAAWIFSHECGRRVGPHTHLALYIPGAPCTYRREFKAWARAWGSRRCGKEVAHAIRGRGPAKETPWLHWLTTSYLLKGYDPTVVVQSGRNAPGGDEVKLGDLIAWPWQDPGPVAMKHRVGWSRSLGPDARAVGYYDKCGPCSRFSPWKTNPWLAAIPEYKLYSNVPAFRSKYEDGIRDVQELYPYEFYTKITRIYSGPSARSVGGGGGGGDGGGDGDGGVALSRLLAGAQERVEAGFWH